MEKGMKDLLLQVKTIGAKQDEATVLAEIEALETKANEVMNTGATGFGAELVPTEVMGQTLDLIPKYSALLPLLPGNHGRGLEMKEVLPVIGEAQIFSKNSEWTTGNNTITADGSGPATADVTIEQGQFILNIAVSKRELAYSVEQLEAVLRDRIAKSAARTVDAYILNADTASSGNVNLDGGTPGATAYYKQVSDGIRKLGIANGASLGTFDEDDVVDLFDKIGEYAADINDLLIVTNRKTYNKMLKFANLKTYDKNSTNATIQTGVLANIFGVDILVHRDMPALTDTNGKVSSTGENNTKGSIALIWKPAVQYGFGKIEDFEVTRVAGKGVILTSTFEFGFGIPDAPAGLDKMVTVGYNITL